MTYSQPLADMTVYGHDIERFLLIASCIIGLLLLQPAYIVIQHLNLTVGSFSWVMVFLIIWNCMLSATVRAFETSADRLARYFVSDT